MAECPSRLRINGYPWKIVHVPDLKNGGGKSAWGCCSTEDHAISLTNKFPCESLRATVLVHEIMHALWWYAGLPDEASEEQVCHIIGYSLAAVLQANPRLRTYLDEAFR